eukprot:g6806.t1
MKTIVRGLLLLLVVLLTQLRHVPGRQLRELVDDETTAEALSHLPEHLFRVTVDAPFEGEVAAPTLPFGLSVKSQNGTFPDILLAMEVFQEGAAVDFRCSPYNASETNYAKRNYPWQTNSAQGTDYLFISTNAAQYRTAISATNDVADFLCLIERHNGVSPQFSIDMDVSYEKRRLVKDERDAMKNIYDKCCQNEGACQNWIEKWHSVEIEKKQGTRKVTNFDFCHMTSSVCDSNGHLLKLYMDKFELQCQFPIEEISKLERLEKLVLSSNDLTGNIFKITRGLRQLRYLDEVVLANNKITGTLSVEFESETSNPLCILVKRSLKHLHLERNDITGPLPKCLFASGSQLRDLILDHNPISGSIPDVFDAKSALEILRLANSNLTGGFPKTLTHVENLVLLDLSMNELEGIVPGAFGASTKLRHLHLNNNRFIGKVPSGIAASISLETIDVSHNRFDAIPAQWLNEGPTTPIVNLDLSHNEITNDFPAAIAVFPKLSTLYMNKNKFQGPLPETNEMFPNAWAIDLSDNNFIGNIPREWATIGLFVGSAEIIPYTAPMLNLSNNQFTGVLPELFHDVDKLPANVVRGRHIDVSGNLLTCPETGDILHLIGMEHCNQTTKPRDEEEKILGEREFNIPQNTSSHQLKNLTSITENSVIGDVHAATLSESVESEGEGGNSGTPILPIVLCAVGGIVVVLSVVVIAMRHRARQAEKKAFANPKDNDEVGASGKPRYGARDEAENSRLRISTKSSDQIKL